MYMRMCILHVRSQSKNYMYSGIPNYRILTPIQHIFPSGPSILRVYLRVVLNYKSNNIQSLPKKNVGDRANTHVTDFRTTIIII